MARLRTSAQRSQKNMDGQRTPLNKMPPAYRPTYTADSLVAVADYNATRSGHVVRYARTECTTVDERIERTYGECRYASGIVFGPKSPHLDT